MLYINNMNQNLFLKQGEQTQITDDISKIASGFSEEGLDLVVKIIKWIRKNLKSNSDKKVKDKVFRQRTADQIIKDGYTTGCTDIGLVFIALARAKNIPTKYVETIRRKWMESEDEDFIEGHIFAEVFFNDKWYIIDPTEACLKFWYDRWIVFAEGLDSWDIGIRNYQELKEKFIEFRRAYKVNKN